MHVTTEVQAPPRCLLPPFRSCNSYVEEYRMSDVARELGFDRARLVELAMLLGSDYTEV